MMTLILAGVAFMALQIWVGTSAPKLRRRRRQFWEAPPFPLENEDRVANYNQKRYQLRLGQVSWPAAVE